MQPFTRLHGPGQLPASCLLARTRYPRACTEPACCPPVPRAGPRSLTGHARALAPLPWHRDPGARRRHPFVRLVYPTLAFPAPPADCPAHTPVFSPASFRKLSTRVIHIVGNLHACSSTFLPRTGLASWRLSTRGAAFCPHLWIKMFLGAVVKWTTWPSRLGARPPDKPTERGGLTATRPLTRWGGLLRRPHAPGWKLPLQRKKPEKH